MEKEAKPRFVRLLLEFRLKLSPKFEWSNFPFTEKGGTCCSREREFGTSQGRIDTVLPPRSPDST